MIFVDDPIFPHCMQREMMVNVFIRYLLTQAHKQRVSISQSVCVSVCCHVFFSEYLVLVLGLQMPDCNNYDI